MNRYLIPERIQIDVNVTIKIEDDPARAELAEIKAEIPSLREKREELKHSLETQQPNPS